jgi:hypothetical protein
MSPLAQILASASRSLNDGLLALALIAFILVFTIIAAAETVGPTIV